MVCKVYQVLREILVTRVILDRQDSRANQVKLDLEVLPEGMGHQVHRVCWVWLVLVVPLETMVSMGRVVLLVHPVPLALRVMELVMTQLLWRLCLAMDKSVI